MGGLPQDFLYKLALWDCPGIGPKSYADLIQHFGSAREVVQARPQEFEAIAFLNRPQREALKQVFRLKSVETKIRLIERRGIAVVEPDDPDYPSWLLHISSVPPFLFYVGDVSWLSRKPLIAVVGSRLMTAYGKQVIENFVPELVDHGMGIVSGMAYGVDGCSHENCLRQGGLTAAVQAQGVEKAFPTANSHLYSQILDSGGCVLSEFCFLDAKHVSKQLFPRRNRILSGLCQAVLVVEAKEKSGALITAHYALEQNRSVYAVPGNIHQSKSLGCLKLIQEGAQMVIEPQDILKDIQVNLKGDSAHKISQDVFESPLEQRIYELCLLQPMGIDEIFESLDEPFSFVSAAITKMELAGRLQACSDRKFMGVALA